MRLDAGFGADDRAVAGHMGRQLLGAVAGLTGLRQELDRGGVVGDLILADEPVPQPLTMFAGCGAVASGWSVVATTCSGGFRDFFAMKNCNPEKEQLKASVTKRPLGTRRNSDGRTRPRARQMSRRPRKGFS